MASVLSTKNLSASQQGLIFHAGLGLVQYNAIAIEYLDFQVPEDTFDFFVFTSKNGVKAVLDWQQKGMGNLKSLSASSVPMAFCVGAKTQALLETNDIKVTGMANSASALTQQIQQYSNASFLVFSGNRRMPELPEFLKRNTIRYSEVISYGTHLTPRQFDRSFDGILFFSPSGVESHASKNQLSNAMAFCIGATTAEAAKNYTDHIITANKPTVENVIVQAINTLIPHD